MKLPDFILEDVDLFRAYMYADRAHTHRTEDGEPQLRKYSGKPYVVHPIAVASILNHYEADKNMMIAALLHDVVEDTLVDLDEIRVWFGQDVAYLVEGMTKKSMLFPEKNRAERKEIDRQDYATFCWRVHTIKVADIIHNARTIPYNDEKGFAKLWLSESLALLSVLKRADYDLWKWAMEIVVSRLELIRK